MTTPATATINGLTLLRSKAAQWTLRYGVQPNIEQFDMTPEDAEKLHDAFGPLTLLMTTPDGAPVVVTNLWCLNILPGPNPYISTVVIADRRCWWSYKWVGPNRYNHRREIGNKRLFASDDAIRPDSLAPDIAYWPETLIAKKRVWNAQAMMQDVLEDLALCEKDLKSSVLRHVFDERLDPTKRLPIEDETIDGAGDLAVAQALSFLPEADIYIDYEGVLVVTSKATGSEADVVAALMPEIRETTHTDLVLNRNVRPRGVVALFSIEAEVRFDFVEVASTSSTTTALNQERRVENVLPIPDYTLAVSGKTLVQGTWITLDQAFVAWGNMPIEGTAKALDHPFCHRAFVPGMDLWEALGIFGRREYNADWIKRISTVEEHYRTTFRINPKWTSKWLSFRANRVSTVNPLTGTRAPSPVYGDYCIIPSQKVRWRDSKAAHPLDWAINRSAYPTTGNLDSTAETSPAVLSILDHDQGIIHLDYVVDPIRRREMVLPSQIVEGSMPTCDLTQTTRSIAWNAVVNAVNPPRLSPSLRVAVVISAVPGVGPNQLYRVPVSPAQVAPLLPQFARSQLNDARGPVMEVRIGPQMERARVVWDDSRATDIEKVFGVSDGVPNLAGLVLNEGASSGTTGASLNRIALARATAIYASLTDRYEMEMTGYMNGNVYPAGYGGELTHRIDPQGVATTVLSMPRQVQPMDLRAFLDSSTRQAMDKLVQPQ